MKPFIIVTCLLMQAVAIAQPTTTNYPVDSASVEHAGVPKGEVLRFTFDQSKIFPGTWREYWVYIPAQYKADKPACVYINQDGIQWKAPTVFDNLIYKKEMPVTIGVFVTPGRVMADSNEEAQHRYNRSFEYDGLGDAYAQFILTELLPEVEKKKASDGRSILLSKNGNDRAIGGSSSGAIAAFTAAWERPDAFTRVFSAIGTYTGLRGGDRYPVLIRKYEPKPIRVFLQDGSNDLNIYGGDWWKANEMMERALTFSGYEVNHVWGDGAHSGAHGTSLFPDAMRWLWKDWPKPIAKGNSKNDFISSLLIPGEDWELVGDGYQFTEGTTVNAKGEAFYLDIPASKNYQVGLDGKLTQLNIDTKKASGASYGADGRRYMVANATKQIISYDDNGNAKIVTDNIAGNDLVVAKNGNMYVTVPDGSINPGKIYLVRPNGDKLIVDEGLKYPNGVTLSPDQTQLFVTESSSHWVWVFKVMNDGSLAYKQKFGWLHVPDTEENAWADGIKCDTAGRVYVTTRLGIQVLDPLGRVNAIIPIPSSKGQASNICFGGKNFDMIYVSAVDKVFRRKLKTRGVNSFEKPVKPANPRM